MLAGLSISQSDDQCEIASLPVSHPIIVLLLLLLMLVTRFRGDHCPVAVRHRRSMYPSADAVLRQSLPTSSRPPPLLRVYAWLVPNRSAQYRSPQLGLWLTYAGRFTVSRKTPSTVNRKVRLVGREGERQRHVWGSLGSTIGEMMWQLCTVRLIVRVLFECYEIMACVTPVYRLSSGLLSLPRYFTRPQRGAALSRQQTDSELICISSPKQAMWILSTRLAVIWVAAGRRRSTVVQQDK